jgi:glycerophosphoryl diester phosphodiesterase
LPHTSQQQLEDDLLPSSITSTSTTSISPGIPFPAVIGHRGCLYDELENTRQGFQKCIAMGCGGVELDVFALKCGTLIVFHGSGTDQNPGLLDDYMKNIATGDDLSLLLFPRGSRIMDYTYQEILQYDWTFNVNHDEFPCPKESILQGKIPTLEQVLQDIKDSSSSNLLHVTMELKGGHQLPERVLQLVDDMNMANQTSCSSFNMEFLVKVRSLRPQQHGNDSGPYCYKTGILFNDPCDVNVMLAKAREVGANEIHLRYDTCTKGLIDRIHQQGFGSMAWFRGPVGMRYDSTYKYLDVGNEDESMYHAVLQTGVQQMCVNKPDVLLGLREKLLSHAQTNKNRKVK